MASWYQICSIVQIYFSHLKKYLFISGKYLDSLPTPLPHLSVPCVTMGPGFVNSYIALETNTYDYNYMHMSYTIEADYNDTLK